MFRQTHRYLNGAIGGALQTPLDVMGANLVGWWNADSAAKITTTGAGVSSWQDEIGNYDLVQGTDANRPPWSATSFNGRGGVTGNGTSQFLRLASTPAAFPIGTNTSEIWVCCSQDQAGSSAGVTNAFNYGGTTSTPVRAVQRTTTGGTTNIARVAASSATATNAAAFTGRHYIRAQFLTGNLQVDQDGVAGTPSALTLTTTAANTTMFASNAATAIGWFTGVIHQVLVLNTTPSAAQITALNAYFAARL